MTTNGFCPQNVPIQSILSLQDRDCEHNEA